jgi:thymidylate synthase (FAD)
MKIVHKSTVELLDWMGDDLSVVDAARVCFDKESEWQDSEANILFERDEKLINYLARNGHWSPFAHTALKFRINAPIFVARQLVKHQVGLSWNEVSRRYVDSEPEFYIPEAWRKRAENVKQGSSDETIQIEENKFFINTENGSSFGSPLRMSKIALDHYNGYLKQGVAPEQARMILPQNTMTSWIWTGSLYAFARVCKERLDPHAQKETRDVAIELDKECEGLYPVSWTALKGTR